MFRSKYAVLMILAGLFCAGTAFAYTSPGKPSGFVNDFAAIVPAADRAALEAKLAGVEQKTGDEIVVATVPSLGDETVDSYAVKLFAEWGIGKKGKDNGLLILVAPNDRQARIEVGYGLEPIVTDADASVIVRKAMLPAFKAGDYAGGIDAAVDKVIGLVGGDPEAVQFVAESGGQPVPLFVPIIGIAILFVLISTKGGRRILALFFINGLFRGRGGRGGWGGGQGGGGFGGFGGGRSGGGGASGSW